MTYKMYSMFLVCIAAVIIASVECAGHHEEEIEDWRQFVDILRKPRIPERYRKPDEIHESSSAVNGFTWKSCGDPSYPTTIDQISVSPDPMKLPGNVSVSFKGSLNVPLKAPLTLDLEVQKKVVFWITVPCIEHFGSCNYPDVCQLIPLLNCPPVFKKYGIPCQCPIKEGPYTMPPSDFFIDDSRLPSLLTDGDYRVTAKLSQGSQNILCLYLEFSITK